ncbi:TnsA-like heteromeric transposase endonuclease subunit [Streptomyces albogriseolus]|uniref:TnsA-like heteromeric transposase endonuclease subunit n=1 Tax=Streptomyces albogriseolus TaxID=1887 RepID=UPI00367D4A2F
MGRLAEAAPWRTFRSYRGQQHFSGAYWSATLRDHVIYESRLELARLLFADFDPSVWGIVAQPFLMKVEVDGKVRRHVPDFLLMTRDGPKVVDVKPFHRLSEPTVGFTFGWARQLVEARGWPYEVWSEPPQARLENIRFLAGYRRPWLFRTDLLEAVLGAGLDGVPLGEASSLFSAHERPQVQAAVHHLLWTGHLVTDLDGALHPSHVLRVAA